MSTKTFPLIWLGVVLATMSMAGCSRQESPENAPTPPRKTVMLFAAASTGPALDEIVALFNRRHDCRVQTNFAGSSTLAQQIANGAEADVFLSANEDWADFLEKKNLVARREDLLGNRLVILLPTEPPVEVHSPADLLNDEIHHIALGDPDSVPAGMYARQALTKLGLWDRLAPKVVAAADVRQALVYVETRSAEAGIVYATDAASSQEVTPAAEIDPALTDPIRYPLVILSSSAHPAEAAVLFDFLASAPALKIFRKYGFSVLSESGATGTPVVP